MDVRNVLGQRPQRRLLLSEMIDRPRPQAAVHPHVGTRCEPAIQLLLEVEGAGEEPGPDQHVPSSRPDLDFAGSGCQRREAPWAARGVTFRPLAEGRYSSVVGTNPVSNALCDDKQE